MTDWFAQNGIQTAQPAAPPPPAAPDWFASNGIQTAQPDFKSSNQVDENGQPIVDPNTVMGGLSKAWNTANTPLLPQIASAGHAIADYLSKPRLGDQALNDHIPGLGTLSAALRGGVAGLVEGAGDMAASLTTPIGAVMTLAGLSSESAIVKQIPALKALIELPQVRALQKAVQAAGGTGFAAHGAGQVATAPTLGGKAQGVAELAAGTLGVAGALRSPSTPPPVARPNLSPIETASNTFAEAHDVPLDAATATGSRTYRAMEKRVANSIGGEGTAERMIGDQQAALKRVGGDLAGQSNEVVGQTSQGVTFRRPGASVQPVQAGEGIRDTIAETARQHAIQASNHYGVIQKAEDATPSAFAIDVSAEQKALKPLYERLARESELVPGSVMGDKATALKALDRFINGPEVTRLTTLDEVVSDLRGLSGANNTSLQAEARTAGQGIALEMVRRLDSKVRQAARAAGPEIVNALEDGRAATAAKYEALNVGELLRDEPEGIFRQLTSPGDAGLNKLRAVQQVAPQQLPAVGRAVLEKLMALATERDKFDHADKLYAEWQKLGPETKKLLFGQNGTSAQLDQFFLLAKRLAENPNPSGTAHVNNVFNWFSTVGTYPMAKLLYTPGGVGALTKFLKAKNALLNGAPTSAATLSRAAQTAGWAEVAAVARRAGVQLPVLQAASADPSATTPQ